MAKNLVVNPNKCLACKSCELACALVHSKSKVLEEALLETPKPQSRVTVEAVDQFAVPIQCRHCEDAPCITICPTAAIHRHSDDAPVLIDKELCIGCKLCLIVCPFGVIDMTRDAKAVTKCDLCLERTDAGQEPACAASCPTGALQYKELEQLTAERRKKAAKKAVAEQKKSKKNDTKEKNDTDKS